MDYNHFRNNLSIEERLAAQQEARKTVKQSLQSGSSSIQLNQSTSHGGGRNDIMFAGADEAVAAASSFPHYILQTLQE